MCIGCHYIFNNMTNEHISYSLIDLIEVCVNAAVNECTKVDASTHLVNEQPSTSNHMLQHVCRVCILLYIPPRVHRMSHEYTCLLSHRIAPIVPPSTPALGVIE